MSNCSSNRSLRSYLLDWVLILTVVSASLALLHVNPDSHSFSVVDLSISYAHREHPKVPFWLLIVLSVVAPVLVITLVSLRFTQPELRLKARKLNDGLLGLGISLGSATIILNVKNLAGKPRPDFLAICQPDLNNVEAHMVGGFAQSLSPLWVMVDRSICQQPDHMRLNDALRSFPSGYSTIAFAGLFYLSLWLCGQFRITPFLPSLSRRRTYGLPEAGEDAQPMLPTGSSDESSLPRRVPSLPVYFLFLPYLPFGIALFIAGTRYFDFRNHGIDVTAGAAAGTAFAYIGWRWCHC